jgi:hypothetical protein
MAPKWKNVRTALVVGAFHGKNMGNIWEIYGDLWEIYGKYMGMECYSPFFIVVQVTWLVVGRK